ncbi:MAG: hypothetical protein ACW96N_02345 [Candidatus Thorarchaeota archaeon]|jgi:hypothetical protein
MGKEKILGALIFLFAFLVLLYYTWALVLVQNGITGPGITGWVESIFPSGFWHDFFLPDPMFLVILPIWAAAVLIMVIAMWIGWTMLTTPAPEPLEDFDFDEEEVAETKPEE